jgi:ATPase subunit of ABC transporter with duplicated ATPase domains
MSLLTVDHLTHGFGARAIFEDVSFRLLKGEHIGLIGANGEGKSTFMNIITGKIEPDAGTVEWAKRIRIGYLDQMTAIDPQETIRDVLRGAFSYLYEIEAEMQSYFEEMGTADGDELDRLMEETGTLQDLLDHNDFYIIDAKVEEVGRGLGLDALGFDAPASELSGGQRAKVLLAKLLLEKPDILLLDEPTNHLDEVHVNWLRRYLQEYENAFILISHDLPFLNSVINLIYHVEDRHLERYVGTYDDFMAVYEMKRAQQEAAYKRQQQEIADLEDFVARNKARVATRNMAMSRQKKLDKMERIEMTREKPKPSFHFAEARTSGKLIFETKDLVIGYDTPLSKPLNLRFERGMRVAITGANGIGKTTLMKSLIGEIAPFAGEVEKGYELAIGYFEQELKVDHDRTSLEEMWEAHPYMSQFEARSALAKCGLTTMHIENQVRVLSGGEQAKVRFCQLMNRETNVLLLDEPTNHLDFDAKKELARALSAYSGTLLMISHEPDFYGELVDEVWDLEQIG